MSPQKITQQAEKIRDLIVEDDLGKAFEILMDLSKQADGNYWDESLNLNQDYTKLTNETRSGFLTPIQAETNRNLLIDRMLKLTRLIEDNEGKAPIERDGENKPENKGDKKTITKTITVEESSSSGGFTKVLFGVLGLGVLAALAFFFLGKEEQIPVPVEPVIDLCVQTLDEGKAAFKEGDLDRAERIFITAKDACVGNQEAEKWLKRVEVMRQRNAIKENKETNTLPTNQEEKKAERQKQPQVNKPEISLEPEVEKEDKSEEITPVKPTFPDANVDNRAAYVSYRKKGDKAFRAKEYVNAYEIYLQAKAINPTSEIRGKLEATRDLCYRQFFSAGMDDYNVQKYKAAMADFKKAQYYKDFAQVQGMIRRCERALE